MSETRIPTSRAAAILGTTCWTLRDMMRDGLIPRPPLIHARCRTWSPEEIEAARVVLEARRRKHAARGGTGESRA